MNKPKPKNPRGRKPRFGEPTTTRAFRVPVSKAGEIIEAVNEKLKEYETKNEKQADALIAALKANGL